MLSMRASASVRHHHRHHRQRSLRCCARCAQAASRSFVIKSSASTSAHLPRVRSPHTGASPQELRRYVAWCGGSLLQWRSFPTLSVAVHHLMAWRAYRWSVRVGALYSFIFLSFFSLSLSLPRRSGCLPFSLSDSLFPSPTFNHLLKAILLPFLPAPLLLTGS